MIRVLHVIATLDPAGAERQMVHLCRRLDRQEFKPAVCCLTRGGPLQRDLDRAGVAVEILHKRGRWDLGVIRRLARVIRRFRPVILHTWLPTANTLGRMAGLMARVPVMLAGERAADVWKGRVRRWADRALTSHTRNVITNADAVRRFLIRRIGLPDEKIVVIRNGLDLSEFDAAASSEPAAALPEFRAAPVIGMVGRLEEQKGVTFLIEAFAQLPPAPDKAQLWIVGAGPEETALRDQASAAGVSERVHFLGVRSDVPALMQRMDLLVLPSLWEGLPNVILEAMAARLAVVATAVDGVPEAVADGETGRLVPPADPDALAAAIGGILRDSRLRRRFGEAGRRRVISEFAMERMVQHVQRLYREAAAEAQQHAG